MEVKAGTAAELFTKAAQVHGKRVGFGTRLKSRLWKPTTFGEVYDEGAALATALIDMGLERGEHVGLIADNRLEWIIANCGIQLVGAADVPRGTDLTDSDITYILPHADVRVCFIENVEIWKRIQNLKSELPAVETYILMNFDQEAPAGVLHMKDLIEKGKALRNEGDRRAEERAKQVQPEDLSTIIYTSGTTGAPKGVMLQHSNIMYMIDCIPVDLGPHDRALSILPVWHIFERALEMFSIAKGCSTYYSSIRMLGDDLKNVQPTFMGSAPRLWEVLYMRILDNAQAAHPVRRFLFHTGYGLAEIYKNSMFYLQNRKLHLHKPNPLLFALGWVLHLVRWLLVTPLYGFFNVAVLERIRQAAGASLKATISGGGALPRHVDQFFTYVGIPVLEGYGMTETAGPITARTVKKLVIETVGPVLEGVEIRIVDLNHGEVLYPNPKNKYNGRGLRGEIHVKGPIVMRGYYKNQEATDKVMKDGWMNTGDIGMMTFNDCVKILGRSKDTIVLASGENVEPVPIENRLLQSPLIDHVMVVGQDEKSLGALIVPSIEGFKSLGYESLSVAELAEHPDVEKEVARAIKQEISSENGFKSFERVTDFRLVPKTFEAADELTAKLSLRRHVITEKYQHLIDEIYGRTPSEKSKAAK
ncbi:MAG: long-chain fatty acid--CoA ligase [Spirochaetaceae bacterium]|nr:long-chain fatty acid--CoA ligase [Spirochaetaceae bacterium]|tara:strand:- start:54120 stop:56057 length:1938 start_codon:yes stop_codon:yes gene_type:complete